MQALPLDAGALCGAKDVSLEIRASAQSGTRVMRGHGQARRLCLGFVRAREAKSRSGAATYCWLKVECALMSRCDSLRNRQSEASPSAFSREEWLECALADRTEQAGAVILDRELDRRTLKIDRNGNVSCLLGRFDRIEQQVGDHLAQGGGVAAQRGMVVECGFRDVPTWPVSNKRSIASRAIPSTPAPTLDVRSASRSREPEVECIVAATLQFSRRPNREWSQQRGAANRASLLRTLARRRQTRLRHRALPDRRAARRSRKGSGTS
jgi:hypothetical protein